MMRMFLISVIIICNLLLIFYITVAAVIGEVSIGQHHQQKTKKEHQKSTVSKSMNDKTSNQHDTQQQ